MNAPLPHPPDRPHHLPLLRRRLRRAGDARRRGRRRRSPAIRRIRRISAGCARRARRSARRSASPDACCIRWCGRRDGTLARADWDDRARPRRRRLPAHHRARRTGRRRVLSLGPVAHRGLLRRQQADEGLHRQRQCRHQFAPVHGVVGRRPSPRLRRRHRARHLRGSRPGRSHRAGRLQRRLVPSGAVPAHGGEQGARAARRSSSSIRAAPRPPRRPICSRHRARHGHGAVLRPAGASRRRRRARLRLHQRAHDRLRGGARARARDRARCSPRPPRVPASPRATSRSSSTCSARRGAPSPASRKASTSRRRAPTRSTPSSIAISPPAASASPAWARSRSPASRTPWAAARSAGSPISSPPTWAFPPDEVDRVRRFWNAPRMATREGHKAVEMFDAIARGEIKALWVMAHQSGGVAAARRRGARGAEAARAVRRLGERASRTTPSNAGAHVLLPAAAWGEKDGTVTNSERRISRQRAFLPRPARRCPTGGSSRRSASAWASPTRSPIAPPPTSSASTPRCRRSRTTARAISTSAASAT